MQARRRFSSSLGMCATVRNVRSRTFSTEYVYICAVAAHAQRTPMGNTAVAASAWFCNRLYMAFVAGKSRLPLSTTTLF